MVTRGLLVALVLGLASCGGEGPDPGSDAGDPTRDGGGALDGAPRDAGQDARPAECDLDGDGFESIACGGSDCDDDDRYRFPGNAERCDGVLPNGEFAATHDEDCDPCTVFGFAPDGDQDADLYPSDQCSNPWPGNSAPLGCDPNRTRLDDAENLVRGADCQDDPAEGGANIRPNQVEICFDMIDNNCDGGADTGVFYRDQDADGFGDPDVMMEGACVAGWVPDNRDCNDAEGTVFPGALDRCDRLHNDCDLPMGGEVDASEDMDDDGHSPIGASCLGQGEPGGTGAFREDDCEDNFSTDYEGAPEICEDGRDNDCDGDTDEAMQRVCADADLDGHGDPGTIQNIPSCDIPAGYSEIALCDDCDDRPTLGAERYPGATEWCDRFDSNCSEGIASTVATEEDVDNDGYASPSASCIGRETPGAPDTAFYKTDCADDDRTVNPGALEICDGVDANCSSGGLSAPDEDMDLDGHTALDATCVARGEMGATASAYPRDDCDDSTDAVHGGLTIADEICDGLDNDCDPATSELAGRCDTMGFCGPATTCVRGLQPRRIAVGTTPAADPIIGAEGFVCATTGDGTVICWLLTEETGESLQHDIDHVEGAIDVAAGEFACALERDGDVRCWQIVDFRVRHGAYLADLATNAVSLDAYGTRACAALEDGSVQCWTSFFGTTPMTIAGLSAAQRVFVGPRDTCALDASDAMTCVGADTNGEHQVSALGGVEDVAFGEGHVCALLDDGSVRCFGDDTDGQLGGGTVTLPSAAEELALGRHHTCARLDDNSVHCWGANDRGQLVLPALGGSTPGATGVSATLVGGGSADFSCLEVERMAGDVRFDIECFGPVTQPSGPAQPSLSKPIGAEDIEAGAATVCARVADNTRCFGANTFGQVGTGMVTSDPFLFPERSSPSLPLQSLGEGNSSLHACGATQNNEVICWGYNTYGQLGTGIIAESNALPQHIDGSDATGLALGIGHTCVIDVPGGGDLATIGGTMSCWGYNEGGQIVIGGAAELRTPTPVPVMEGMTELPIVQVAAGGLSTCGLTLDGRVFCQGVLCADPLNMIPAGTPDVEVQHPMREITLDYYGIPQRARAIVAGGYHYCAITDDVSGPGRGSIVCWGGPANPATGECPNTPFAPWDDLNPHPPATAYTPYHYFGQPTIAIDAGLSHTCAVIASGDVWCWGAGANGALGDGSTFDSIDGTPVTLAPPAAQITTSQASTCVLTDDREAYCWGAGAVSGRGETAPFPAPRLLWSL